MLCKDKIFINLYIYFPINDFYIFVNRFCQSFVKYLHIRGGLVADTAATAKIASTVNLCSILITAPR